MRRALFVVPILALLSIPVGVLYAEVGRSDARRLVDLLRYQDEFESAKRGCQMHTVSPEAILKQIPGYFGTVRPGDDRWPLVMNAYADYVNTLCAHPTVEESLALISETYASKLSADDVRAAIAFYSTPAGQKLVSAHQAVSAALFSAAQTQQADLIPKAMADFYRRVGDISAAKVR